MDEIYKITGISSDGSELASYIARNSGTEEIYNKIYSYQNVRSTYNDCIEQRDALDSSLNVLRERISEINSAQEATASSIQELHKKFFNKYSRFIQEGTWTSENYIDDNLYYLDAQSVAYTSSRPKVSYNISVFRISGLDDFENKIFNLGDITHVEDKEFFGVRVDSNGVATPIKEKVLISEITSNFDDPQKDSIKVQNYKTQFEDLFQRITATTQQLQYAEGAYTKAANAIAPDGTIKVDTLQNSISLNNDLVFSAQNESVITNKNGITVSNLKDVNQKARITSGGLFLSTDGGQSWMNAIRGSGISANVITTGQLNTDEVVVLNGGNATFRWNNLGISAFYQENNGNVYQNKFVRFNHLGLYGIDAIEGSVPSITSESDVWANAKFGATWKGFFIKNKDGGGQVEISSENDIRVIKTQNGTDKEIIKIGRLGKISGSSTEYNYGIRINDPSGNTILEAATANSSTLWLRDKLNIGRAGDNYNVQIGRLGFDNNRQKELVFKAGSQFAVASDGTMFATAGIFEGEITATSGKIGPLNVSETALSVSQIANNVPIFSIDENGVSVRRGGFTVLTKDGDKVFEVLDEGVKVTGEINATSGSFSGYINAGLGIIGGFTIDSGVLSSNDGQYIQTEDSEIVSGKQYYTRINDRYVKAIEPKLDDTLYEETQAPSLQLFGAKGEIFANNITLDSGAKIAKYIHFTATSDGKGDPYIYNPSVNSGQFIDINNGAIYLNAKGEMGLGSITLDGNSSTIKGDNWSISSDWAEFANVRVSGKLATTIFEVGKVQAVGGEMVFKDSFKTASIEQASTSSSLIYEYTIKIDDDENSYGYSELITNNNDWVFAPINVYGISDTGNLSTNIYELKPQKESEPSAQTDSKWMATTKTFKLESTKDSETIQKDFKRGFIVIGATNQDNILISINSNDNFSSFMRPQALTIATSPTGAPSNYITNLILGNLSESSTVGGMNIGGFGLYSDNVFLNGALITKGSDAHAGINTLSQISATKFSDGIFEQAKDTSEIVLWAGNTNQNISEANFQVTKNGSVYANHGKFEGSVFIKADLQSAHIKTATIEGSGSSPSYGLTIKNTTGGIAFAHEDEDEESNIFDLIINNDGMFTSTTDDFNNFIKRDGSAIEFKGRSLTTTSLIGTSDGGLTISVTTDVSYISFKENLINFYQDLNFNGTMRYAKVSDGYNLYVGR